MDRRAVCHGLSVQHQFPGERQGIGEPRVIENPHRAFRRLAGGKGKVPLPDQHGSRRPGVVLRAVGVGRLLAKIAGRNAEPAVTLRDHLHRLAHGGPVAGFSQKDLLAAKVGVGRIDPGGKQLLADELGPLLVPRPFALIGVGFVGQLRIVPKRLGAVVIAVNRQGLLAGRPAAVDHHRPRRVHLLDRLPGPRQHGLPFVERAEVAGIDEVQLVLDGPDHDAGVIALALDPGSQVVDPVVAEFREDRRHVSGGLAVQVAGAAEQRAAAVHERQHFLRLLPQPLVAAPVLRPHAAEAVIELRILERRQVLLRRAAGYAVFGKALPLDTVQPQMDPVDRPLAETEQRLLHVHRLAVHLHRGPQPIAVRLVRPPQFWILPSQIGGQHRVAAAEVQRQRCPTLFDLTRLVVHGFQPRPPPVSRRTAVVWTAISTPSCLFATDGLQNTSAV